MNDEALKAALADRRRAQRIKSGQDVIEVPVEFLRRVLRGDVRQAREALGARTHEALLAERAA